MPAAADITHNGIDSVSAAFFRDRYIGTGTGNALTHYLTSGNDHTVYLSETTGGWDAPDELLFSVEGNPWRWNRYYYNGFRTGSRFHEGSTLWRPNMEHHNLSIDTYTSQLYFTPDSVQPDYVSVSGNAGGLGGASLTTRYLINLFHASAVERLAYETELSHPEQAAATLDPRSHRQHITGAGAVEAQYSIGGLYRQHVYADFGWRQMPLLTESGIAGMMTKPYWKVQADGEIGMGSLNGSEAEQYRLFYMLNASGRDDYGSEAGLNGNETPRNETYQAALYATGKSGAVWTAGLMWETNRIRHDTLSFRRNIVDQDGEAFEPWMPDGQVHELTASATVEKMLYSREHEERFQLSLRYDGSESLLMFAPTERAFSNGLYWRSMYGTENYDLGRTDWTAQSFTAGLLDNTLSLVADYRPKEWFALQGKVELTLDGMLLGHGKSIVRANGQAQLSLTFRPCKWFEGAVTLGDYRTPFGIEHVRFFSDDYLNGVIRLSDGTVAGTTGGAYHRLQKGLWQPRYFVIDLPFAFRFGRHEVAVLSSYRKYYAQWTTRLDGEATDYGYFKPVTALSTGETQSVFFYNNGERRYVVDRLPAMGGNILNNTPYYASNLVRYSYNGKRFYFSASWQSYQMTSTAALATGVLGNDVGVLSELSANPNNMLVSKNSGGAWRHVGRANQDKAYIARLTACWNITRDWQIGASFLFRDGQAFTAYDRAFSTDAAGNTQVAVWSSRTRGINPTDGNFGSRKDAFFNLDVKIAYTATLPDGSRLGVRLTGYNLWDFSTELTEFTFEENGEEHRYAMTLCVPRGLICNIKYEF